MTMIKMPKLPEGKLLINGVWRDAGDGKTAATFNPATEEEIMRVAQATEADVNDAVEAAHDAFENGEWRRMGPHDRARILNKIADLTDLENVKAIISKTLSGL